ncbi:MAG TPA: UvrB/UvrC motif-containing protein, partial [Bacillota bacterium]|nr:UvrB/UvrC motif-containing protein [Bacillota bacterium]
DLPEVSLVAILDADKEGFLRSETSLIQTIGRAARNVDGKVIMYADRVTGSMKRAIDETERRRKIQLTFNREHGITPQTIRKAVADIIEATKVAEEEEVSYSVLEDVLEGPGNIDEVLKKLEKEMREAAARLDFELAAALRDRIFSIKKRSHKA